MTLQQEREKDKFLCFSLDNGKANTAYALLPPLFFSDIHIHHWYLCQPAAPHGVGLTLFLGAAPYTVPGCRILIVLMEHLKPKRGPCCPQWAKGGTPYLITSRSMVSTERPPPSACHCSKLSRKALPCFFPHPPKYSVVPAVPRWATPVDAL